MMEHSGHHFIAVFGGSVAGSEAAYQLASQGFRVVVFDQNYLPYGKIEDGLPKWHAKLRDKEEKLIDDKLNQPNIRYVPGVKLGRDIDFVDVANNWGFSAVLVATGAWRDRSLPIDGIDAYVDKGLVYQNPLVYWFNHYHEPDYQGKTYNIPDGALVVGGGLASLDVVKIVMIETVQRALAKKGVKTDIFELDRSIAKVLQKNELTLEDLELKGCTLIYRRRDIDMPLSSLPKDTPEQKAKAETVNQKILENFKSKYLFNFIPCCMPHDKIVENGQLKGLVLQKTDIRNNRVVPLEGDVFEIRSDLVISSIGSIPEKINGIPSDGPLFKLINDKTCKIEGYDNVFALGNAVTGRGNIKESLEHGKETTHQIMENFLEWEEEDYQNWLRSTEANIVDQVNTIAEEIGRKKFMSDEVIQSILVKTEALQKKSGYGGDYSKWIDEKTPVRVEQLE